MQIKVILILRLRNFKTATNCNLSLDLKYISKYLPNNKCAENIDHHDHEAETVHLHQHGKQSCNLKSDVEQNLSTISYDNILVSDTNKLTLLNNNDIIISPLISDYLLNNKIDMSKINIIICNTNSHSNPTTKTPNTQTDNSSSLLIEKKRKCTCTDSITEGEDVIREHKHSEHASTSRLDDVLSRHSHSHGHSHRHKYKVGFVQI